MPRQPREKSNTGIYHIIARGINRQQIFHEDADFRRYLTTLRRIAVESEAAVLGYCLMSNHVHLLFQEGKVGISGIMHRVGASYAIWYNCKYQRSGHVFQDRFKSEQVEDDSYLLTAVRYIHQNPVKAGLVNSPETYRWSSCGAYYGLGEYMPGFTQTQLILALFAENKELARQLFIDFSHTANTDTCLENDEIERLSDESLRQGICAILQGKPICSLLEMETAERDELIKRIRAIEGSSLRRIASITGLSIYRLRKS